MGELSEVQRLRNLLGGAGRAGRTEDIVRLRRELVVARAERDLRKHLAGVVLGAEETERLVGALHEFTDPAVLHLQIRTQAENVLALVEALREHVRGGQVDLHQVLAETEISA